MPVTPADFRRALAQFASGVTVVTTREPGGRPLGLTVSAFCSVSLEPPLVLVCVDNRSDANAGITGSRIFNVSVLGEGQEEVSRRFAQRGPGKFDGVLLAAGENGAPTVPGAIATIECRLETSHEAGDHQIHIGEVTRIAVEVGRPLVYYCGGYRRLGS
jgi:flavin reductase (DIM6/NTAB) family NADH-FMN oxidoreductase RutF